MELESVIADLAPRIFAYCHGITRDRAVAEDAAQDALTALVTRWRRNGPPDSPAAFAFAIARRRAGRALARRRWFAYLREPEPGVQIQDPGRQAAARSEVAHVLAALANLRRRDRHALLLIAVAEIEYPEAAAVLSVSVNALKMRVHRARRRLAALLDGGTP